MMSIRVAVESDANDIYAVHTSSIREICSRHYTDEQIKAWISRQSVDRYLKYILKAEIVVVLDDQDGGRVTGFAHLSSQLEDESQPTTTVDQDWSEAFVRALYIHPNHVRKGQGHHLLDYMQGKALQRNAKNLTVFSTINAIPFYEKHGFKVIGLTALQCGNCVNLNCTRMEKQL